MDDLKQQWENLPQWQKLLVIFGFSFALIYLIYILFLSEKLDEKNKLAEEVGNLSSEVETLENSIKPENKIRLQKQLQQIKKEIEELNNKLAVLEKKIPSKPETDEILDIIYKDSKQAKLTLSNFKIEKEEDVYISYNQETKKVDFFVPTDKNKNPPQNSIKLKKQVINTSFATDDMSNLSKFINILSKEERFISIENMEIKKEGQGLKINLSISTYYLGEV